MGFELKPDNQNNIFQYIQNRGQLKRFVILNEVKNLIFCVIEILLFTQDDRQFPEGEKKGKGCSRRVDSHVVRLLRIKR